jgi:hypothetical protein
MQLLGTISLLILFLMLILWVRQREPGLLRSFTLLILFLMLIGLLWFMMLLASMRS